MSDGVVKVPFKHVTHEWVLTDHNGPFPRNFSHEAIRAMTTARAGVSLKHKSIIKINMTHD